jgi:FMN phosphatase YigB (HAD superfamily)
MKNKVILFDIDHTLFNGQVYREKMFKGMAKRAKVEDEEKFVDEADGIYFEMRKAGPFFPDEYAEMLVKKLALPVAPKELEEVIWDEEILRASLFEEAIEVLKVLSKKKDITLGIFSAGPLELQRAKIKTIEEYFPKEHIHIFMEKTEEILGIVKKYKNDELYLIDDLLEILYNAKRLDKNVYTIWVKRGWLAKNQKPIEGFRADKTIESLKEILPIFLSV